MTRLWLDANFSFVERRDIEDVVEHIEQMACRGVGGLHVIGLLGTQAGRAEKAQHAKNSIERRAQLVAHIRQKFTFAAVGPLCLDLGFAKVRVQCLRFALGCRLPALVELHCHHSQQQ